MIGQLGVHCRRADLLFALGGYALSVSEDQEMFTDKMPGAPLKSPGTIWVGATGGRSLFMAVLTEDHLYFRNECLGQATCDDAVHRLQRLESPEEVLGTQRTHKISLANINELRLSSALNLVEIYHGPSNRRFVIQSLRDPIHEWVYAALWERLAPDAQPKAGNASLSTALTNPIFALVLALVFSTGFIYWAMDAKANPHHEGVHSVRTNAIEKVLYKIGAPGTIAIAAVINLSCVTWFVYRWKHPPSAEVIAISGPKVESP
jgi:hypothetical protein